MCRKGAPEQPPTDEAVLERALSLCNEACFTVALQRRRLKTDEPEDAAFPLRWHADTQFLIVALRRVRRAAELAANVPAVAGSVGQAIADFDRRVPSLAGMRNVAEHFEDYALDAGRDRTVSRKQLQVSTWDGAVFSWLNLSLDVDEATDAAASLLAAIRQAARAVTRPAASGPGTA